MSGRFYWVCLMLVQVNFSRFIVIILIQEYKNYYNLIVPFNRTNFETQIIINIEESFYYVNTILYKYSLF